MSRHPNPSRKRALQRDIDDARRDVNWYRRQDQRDPLVKAALGRAKRRLRDAELAMSDFKREEGS